MKQKLSYASKSIIPNADVGNIIPLPPDGGWGWVIVAAAFFCNFVVDGVSYTYGIFLEELSIYFKVTPAMIAIGSSLLTGFYFSFGPLSCAMVNRFGFRLVGAIGGITATIGFIICLIANKVELFLWSFGMISGIGFSMNYAASIICVGFYFERWRALATSLAATGAAVGMLAFPFLMHYLENYQWHFKFSILAGLCGMLSIASLAYLPLRVAEVPKSEKNKNTVVQNTRSTNSKVASASASTKKIFDKYHNTAFPTITELHESEIIFAKPVTNSSSSILEAVTNISTVTLGLNTFNTDNTSEAASTKQKIIYCLCCLELYYSVKRCITCNYQFTQNRPLYRDDILYQGSLITLPEYTRTVVDGEPSRGGLDYRMSVTRVRTQKDLEESTKYCTICPEAVKRVLITMLDIRLMRSPAFAMLVISGFFSILGIYNTFIYMVKRAEEKGLTRAQGQFMLSILGIANMCGRLSFGIIASFPRANPLLISHLSLYISGVAVLISYFLNTVEGHYMFSFVYGFLLSTLGTLRAPIVVQLVSLKQLTNGLGLVLLFEGFAAFIGVPIAGLIAENTGSYNNCYLFAGFVILISALTLMLVGPLDKWEKKKKIEKERH